MMKKIALTVALATSLAFAASPRLATTANNNFGFNIFKSVTGKTAKGNRFLSPVSIYLALAMLQNGAEEETAEEILETVTLAGIERATFNDANLALIDSLTSHKNHTLKIANSIFARDTFNVLEAFKKRTATSYRAPTVPLDFTKSKEAVKRINEWVSQSTNGKIDGIVSEIKDEDVMFLINATYFEAKWKDEFSPNSTFNAPFTRADKKVVEVPFLNQTSRYKYVEAGGLKAIELPYVGDEASLVVVLPKIGQSPDQYAADLSAAKWNALTASIDKAEEATVDVALPKIQLAYEDNLNDALKALGMPRAFDQGAAQLHGISDDPRNLYVSGVRHKTFLKIEEKGTIAAAVTSIDVGAASVVLDLKEFHADRPYFFAIRDKKTNAVLFLGTIAEPEGGTLPERR